MCCGCRQAVDRRSGRVGCPSPVETRVSSRWTRFRKSGAQRSARRASRARGRCRRACKVLFCVCHRYDDVVHRMLGRSSLLIVGERRERRGLRATSACEPIVRRGLSGRVCAGWWGPRVVRRRGYSAFLRDFSGTSWSLFRRERLSWKYGDQSVMGTHVVTVDRVFTPTGVPNVAGNEVASCTVGRLGADRRTHSRAHRTATTCVIARAEPRRRTKAQQAPGQEIH
jgi:hypothetical protein